MCIPVAGGDLQLDLLGTLLSMRGETTPQPLCNDAGDWLLWNGNIFGGGIKVSSVQYLLLVVLRWYTLSQKVRYLTEILHTIHTLGNL